ncbi:MAG: Hpt domain-containing protein [Geminicoccaceae bacterium]
MDTQALLAELRARFLERIDGERQRFSALLALPLSHKRIESARSLAHRIAGGGGTFGLDAVSVAAARLDDALARGIDHQDALRALHRAIETARTPEADSEAAMPDHSRVAETVN